MQRTSTEACLDFGYEVSGAARSRGRLFASAGQRHLRSVRHPLAVFLPLGSALSGENGQELADIPDVEAHDGRYLFRTGGTPLGQELENFLGTRSRQAPAMPGGSVPRPGDDVSGANEPEVSSTFSWQHTPTKGRPDRGLAPTDELAGFAGSKHGVLVEACVWESERHACSFAQPSARLRDGPGSGL